MDMVVYGRVGRSVQREGGYGKRRGTEWGGGYEEERT